MIDKAIICVDDEKTVLESLKSQLRRNFGDDFIYESAEDALEGLELIDDLMKEGITLVLIVSDWLMPGMKGDEFLIKVHEKYPNVLNILLTGQADEKAIARAVKDANLYKFLRKPWDENELVRTIKKGLNIVT